MVLVPVTCPYCHWHSDHVIKGGKTETGKQRYRCQQTDCARRSFVLDPAYKGRLPRIKKQVIDMTLNGSGIRDTARVLKISPTTVINELKKRIDIKLCQSPSSRSVNPHEVEVVIRLADAAEVDDMWSFVRRKKEPRWLWHAIDHRSGKVLAYVFGRRKDEVFLKLKALLEPFRITRYYTDSWGAYTRHLDVDEHHPGKRHTQKIERKHLTLRTRVKRLARKTICFSKSMQMHDIVIGLFVNRYEFGLLL